MVQRRDELSAMMSGLRAALKGLSAMAGLFWLVVGAAAQAAPLVGPGDARLRTDIELLHAHGYIKGPTDAWPLPWAQINRGLEAARQDGALPLHLQAAASRIAALSDHYGQTSRYQARAALATQAALVRGFDQVARNQADVGVGIAQDLGPLHVTLAGSWQSDGQSGRPGTQHGNGFAPDGSQISLNVGDNWLLYAGWTDIWWGAGQDGALLFSTSARPMPKIGFRRLEPFNIDFPVLRWLGPVTFDGFVAKAQETRGDYDNPAIIGMRFAFHPTPWFQIGLNRGLQMCGQGRPCDFNTVASALVGFGNGDNTGTLDEAGNQLAGFDMSYRRPIGKSGQVLKLHFATTAEDEDNFLIEQFARQVGIGVSGAVGKDGMLHDSGIEYVDTQAAKFLGRLQGGQIWPGSTYNNFIYTDGWTFGKRPIGHALDGDARALTLYSGLTDLKNRRWTMAARHIVLNINNNPNYRISQSREKILQFEAGVNWPGRLGDIKATARLQKNAPNTPDRDPLLLQAEMGWTTRF